jgi:microcystin-dependent protein
MSTPFLAELRLMSFGFAPRGWALCNGQLLPINQNQPLFSLLGTTYGGDGRVNFALPNLQGKVPINFDGSNYQLGQTAGEYSHTLLPGEMAQHFHPMMVDATTAPASSTSAATSTSVLGQGVGVQTPTGSFSVLMYGSTAPNTALANQVVANNGGNLAHPNQQPFLTLSYCIALQGIFPSQN